MKTLTFNTNHIDVLAFSKYSRGCLTHPLLCIIAGIVGIQSRFQWQRHLTLPKDQESEAGRLKFQGLTVSQRMFKSSVDNVGIIYLKINSEKECWAYR